MMAAAAAAVEVAGTTTAPMEAGACSSVGACATEQTHSPPRGDGDKAVSSEGQEMPLGCASEKIVKNGNPPSSVADAEAVAGKEGPEATHRLPSQLGGRRFSWVSAETEAEADRLLAKLLLVDKVAAAAAAAAGVSPGRLAADHHHQRRGHHGLPFFHEGATAATSALGRVHGGDAGYSNHSPSTSLSVSGVHRPTPAALAAAAPPSPQSANDSVSPLHPASTSSTMEGYGGCNAGDGMRAGAAVSTTDGSSGCGSSFSASPACSPRNARSPSRLCAAVAPAFGEEAKYFTSSNGVRVRLSNV